MCATDRCKLACVSGLLVTCVAWAVGQTAPAPGRPLAASVIVPQARNAAPGHGAAVEVTGVKVGVVIVDQVATTTMDIDLRNPGGTRAEAELVIPVPAGAVVRGFAFEGAAAEPTAVLLPKDEAVTTYEAIVAKIRDPALLEFVGTNLVRSSVFPVPPGGTQKVRLTYEHVLARDGGRVDYELPRSESLDYRVPWQISVKIKSPASIATAYSPSHEIETTQRSARELAVRLTPAATTTPGPFRLSYLLAGEGVTASLLAYPEGDGRGGYFLLLAGLPPHPAETADTVRREVTLVLDRSGSMNGGKLEQARAAALQVLGGLHEGELFNIIAYNEGQQPFAPRPVAKNAETEQAARGFLARLTANGGTNIHDALITALRPEPAAGALPLVLFLTDGLPTAGNTSEIAIREVATKQNAYERRIFTFGVGVDVNAPLLQKLATETRAKATFVLPAEDVEMAVAGVFRGLQGPVLTGPALDVAAALAGPPVSRVLDLLPARLPDLFEGDQLVVLGRYAGAEPLEFTLHGEYLGQPREFRFRFALDQATTRNAFVPRLWASRRIAHLIETIQQAGADLTDPAVAARDPRFSELTTEIVRLSTEFGVLTEYTAFLAQEGTDLSQRDQIMVEANRNFKDRAVATRSGLGAINQSSNLDFLQGQYALNSDNAYYDENMDRVTITSVQQVNDRAFFRRGSRWVDSRVVEQGDDVTPDRVIRFGTPEFRALAVRLAQENRAGTIALRGDVLLKVGDELVLIEGPERAGE